MVEDLEIWRSILGFEGRYEVSSFGRARSVDRVITRVHSGKIQNIPCKGRVLSAFSCFGYPGVALTAKHKAKISHLVLEAFVSPRPEGMLALHRDDNRENNKLSNLYWGTYSQNWADAVNNSHQSLNRLRTHITSVNRRKRKLTDEQVAQVRALSVKNLTKYKIEQITGIHRATVALILQGKTYVDL